MENSKQISIEIAPSEVSLLSGMIALKYDYFKDRINELHGFKDELDDDYITESLLKLKNEAKALNELTKKLQKEGLNI